jgi:hypothetical protein
MKNLFIALLALAFISTANASITNTENKNPEGHWYVAFETNDLDVTINEIFSSDGRYTSYVHMSRTGVDLKITMVSKGTWSTDIVDDKNMISATRNSVETIYSGEAPSDVVSLVEAEAERMRNTTMKGSILGKTDNELFVEDSKGQVMMFKRGSWKGKARAFENISAADAESMGPQKPKCKRKASLA